MQNNVCTTCYWTLYCGVVQSGVFQSLQFGSDLLRYVVTRGMKTDRHQCFKSGNIPKTEGGQIYLSFVTAL